mmetsp:Transcript_163318/g.301638  ORF Transcript_163318/g.301638 Transcript_163318/m.301638 type:complete len:164 (+) Transcript_163318:397-888(+)
MGKEDRVALKAKYILAKHLLNHNGVEDAYDLLLPTLEAMERSDELGKSHVDTLKAAACLAHILKRRNKLAAAEVCYKYALDGLNFMLGADHQQTQRVNRELDLLTSLGRGFVAEVYHRVANEMENGIDFDRIVEVGMDWSRRVKGRAAQKFAVFRRVQHWGRA